MSEPHTAHALALVNRDLEHWAIDCRNYARRLVLRPNNERERRRLIEARKIFRRCAEAAGIDLAPRVPRDRDAAARLYWNLNAELADARRAFVPYCDPDTKLCSALDGIPAAVAAERARFRFAHCADILNERKRTGQIEAPPATTMIGGKIVPAIGSGPATYRRPK